MAIFHTDRVPLESFGSLISPLVSDLSIGRAQIVAEQVRRIAQSGHPDRLVILSTSGEEPSQRALAAVVAVFQPGVEEATLSDVATIVHAGALQELDEGPRQAVIASLSARLDEELVRHGIRLAQWATDPVQPTDSSSKPSRSSDTWCTAFGFQPIATLDYLCGPVSDDPGQPFGRGSLPADTTKRLRFSEVSWIEPAAFSALIDLVEQTYVETLDCPALANYLSTRQVLNGYRTTEAFTPSMWFIVSDAKGTPVGCTILGTHPSSRPTNATDKSKSVGSVEIVYMGLIPAARGKGLGTQLVQKAFDTARAVGADQVLLAVDQRNHPAMAIYQLAGLTPMVHESVWVKTLAPATSSAAKPI